MKNFFRLFLLYILVFSLLSCSDDNKENEDEEFINITPPTELKVENVTAVSAILSWAGTSDSYQILLGQDTLIAASTSYGLKDLTPDTEFSWKVRAEKNRKFSEWISGETFRTSVFVDETADWIGSWNINDFRFVISAQGITIPSDMFFPDGFENLSTEIIISKKDNTNDRILLQSEFLSGISIFDLTLEMVIKENRASYQQIIKDTLLAPIDNPILIEDLPFISDILSGNSTLEGLIENTSISKLGVIIDGYSITGEKEDVILLNGNSSGKLYILTNNDMLNLLLGLVSLDVSIGLSATLELKQ